MTTCQSNTLLNGIHALVDGLDSGIPIILLPGWPQTAEAFTPLFPLLSKTHKVLALDPPGLGDSAPSPDGYDTSLISRTLYSSLEGLTSKPYHLVGHDIGAWIAYAWASQFPSQILSLTLLDSAIPGHAPPTSFPLSDEMNPKLWQFSFNRLPGLPEILTKGKERELLDWLFDMKAVHPERITEEMREGYAGAYRKEGAMGQGFDYYRAVMRSAEQHKKFKETKLGMRVLALGGSGAIGGGLKIAMEGVAERVEGGVVEDCGHYVMEEQPEVVAKRMLKFYKSVENSKA